MCGVQMALFVANKKHVLVAVSVNSVACKLVPPSCNIDRAAVVGVAFIIVVNLMATSGPSIFIEASIVASATASNEAR